MKLSIRLLARYYLRRPTVYELISVKITTFHAGIGAFLNELCYLLRLERSFRLTSLSIEVTNHCNLACLMCPASATMNREKGFMNEELFRKIIDRCPALEFIFLFQWGEPFLHPRIFELIRYASSKNIRTLITTNGTLCSPKSIESILSSGIERITFSVDGIGEIYEHIRGWDYIQLKATIVNLKKARDLKKCDLKIDVAMVVYEKTEAEIDQFYTEWKDIADGIYLIPRLISGTRKKRCRETWRGNLTILWDGRVVPCCADVNGEMAIGNVATTDIAAIWNSAPIRQLRRLHGRGIFTGICARCSEYNNPRASPRFS